MENSKTGKLHIVCLSTQATLLFRELKTLASRSDWVLPGRGTFTQPLAHNALNSACGIRNIPAFSITICAVPPSPVLHEQIWPSDVVEKALNHTIGGERRVYNRAKYVEQKNRVKPLPLLINKMPQLSCHTGMDCRYPVHRDGVFRLPSVASDNPLVPWGYTETTVLEWAEASC